MYRKNPLKAKLNAGEVAIGCWTHLESTAAAEIIALSGYDAIIIDHEHGSGNMASAVQLMQAISATTCSPIIRVPWNDPVLIKRALDAGPEGIMAPSIETADEAAQMVAACKYPPEGIRGSGHVLARASSYGLAADAYARDNGAELLIIAQIESVGAVERIETITATPGIDMFFIGAVDLSASAGDMGNFENQVFVDAQARAEDAILKSGKKLGGIALPHEDAATLFSRGYHFVMSASDVIMLREAASQNINAASGKDD